MYFLKKFLKKLQLLKAPLNLLILLSLFLPGCASSTLEDYHEEGENMIYSLTEHLQKIRTKEQLIAALPQLQTQFSQLVEVMLAAENLKKHSKESTPEINYELSDKLRFEISRLYQIEGGRAWIEKSQEKALLRLETAL